VGEENGCIYRELSMMPSLPTILVQIELQQRGAWWYIKGCTAYAQNNIKPLPIADEPYPSRGTAIKMMKQIAREELLPAELTMRTRIFWRFVLWFPQNAVRSARHAETASAIHPHESLPSSCHMDEALPTVGG
jgi:hypothetical protein